MFDAKPSQPDVEIDLIIWLNLRIRMTGMPKTFKIGEHVRWNSEAGRVSGIIIKKITSDMKFKKYLNCILCICGSYGRIVCSRSPKCAVPWF
jgi:hypothetical protein